MKYIKLWEEITRDELKALEDYADWLFAKIGVDIVFSNHFKSRINDARSGRPISYEEMVELFTKAYRQAGKEISELPINVSFVLRDIFSKINVPFVVERILEMVNATSY